MVGRRLLLLRIWALSLQKIHRRRIAPVRPAGSSDVIGLSRGVDLLAVARRALPC